MEKSAKIIPGADCGSDHELLIAKFRLKLKKVDDSPKGTGDGTRGEVAQVWVRRCQIWGGSLNNWIPDR